MSNEKDKKKISGVSSASQAKGVQGTGAVDEVSGVKAATGVGGVAKAGKVGGARLTRNMSLAEREELFRMIDQEAEKLFGQSGLPAEKRKMVQSAVKMVLDAGILPEEGSGTIPSGKLKR